MTQVQDEKRKFPRLNALTDIVYRKKEGEPDKLALSKNISAGGICLIAYEKLEIGDLLELKVYLNSYSEIIPTVGKVVWVKEFQLGDKVGKRYDVGVEFVKISQGSAEKIKNYVGIVLNKQ